MPHRSLLPRALPRRTGVSSRAIGSLLDALHSAGIECHSLMVVHRGHVVAEGWWAPYTAERPHLLYSMTKSVTALAVGLTIDDGLLTLESRVVEILPTHVPTDVSEQASRLTVHHLLSMTAGHALDTLDDAWQREPGDLVKGFLSAPFAAEEGTLHTYDNATTFVLARMVEKVTGQGLPEYLESRLFAPLGIEDAEWDRVGSGLAFGFHGLHLRTEGVAAIGELLRRGGEWSGAQLISREWVERATSKVVDSRHYSPGEHGIDFESGYGYQTWRARDGFHLAGAFGQHCIVLPRHELVVVVTSAQHLVRQAQDVLDAVHDVLVPGIGRPESSTEDDALARRLTHGALQPVEGAAGPATTIDAVLLADAVDPPLPDGSEVSIEPMGRGWHIGLKPLGVIDAGYGRWLESAPAGRPICASGAWDDGFFTARLHLITTPHHLVLVVDANAGTASLAWDTLPLTGPDLLLHATSPLMTRPDVA